MLSGWHVHAKGYAREINVRTDAKVTAVWDEIPDRGDAWAKELACPFHADLDGLLADPGIDAVAVCAPTNVHEDVMVRAAQAGKHIFTEKVMALTVKECRRIADAVTKAGVKFCISLPHRAAPQNLFAKRLIEDGLLGQVTTLRVRNAHGGASDKWLPAHFYDPVQCGGGAMMDLGAHVMYLTRWLLGRPVRATSLFNRFTDHPVEDNAITLFEFPGKAIAMAETSFVTPFSPYGLEVYGTEGSLFVGGPENNVRVTGPKFTASDCKGWLTVGNLPKPLPAAIAQWIDGICNNTPIHFGLEEGIDLTEMMEAAYLSAGEKRTVEFAELGK